MVSDRLSEIRGRMERGWPGPAQQVYADIAWLVNEIERLRAEVAYLRDHPCWIPPVPPDPYDRLREVIRKALHLTGAGPKERFNALEAAMSGIAALRAGPPGGLRNAEHFARAIVGEYLPDDGSLMNDAGFERAIAAAKRLLGGAATP